MSYEEKQKYFKELLVATYNEAYSNQETNVDKLVNNLTEKIKNLLQKND